MNFRALIFPAIAAALVSACTIADPNLAAGPRTTTDRFLLALADGYKARGDIESAEYDPVGANMMYEKSGMAARGQAVPVGDPMEWDARRGHPPMWGRWVVGFDNKQTLATALDYRTRLSAWIDATKARDPAAAATQQVAFECWLEEMSEDHVDDVAACGLNPASWVIAAAAPPPAPAPAPAPAPSVPKTYLVFFDFDRSDITPEAANIIRQAAGDAKRGNVRVVVTGHADRAGATDYNQRLSERRAASVRAALVREGVAASTIQMSGRGENDNLVATPDGAREPRNRRVEIAFR